MKWKKYILVLFVLLSCVSCGKYDRRYNDFYFRSSIHYFLGDYKIKTLWIRYYDEENDNYMNYKTNKDLVKLLRNATYSEIENVDVNERSSNCLFFSDDIPEDHLDYYLEYKYYFYPNNVISVYHQADSDDLYSDAFFYIPRFKYVERFYSVAEEDYNNIISLVNELLSYCRCCEN